MKSLPDILRKAGPNLMPKGSGGNGSSMGWGDLRQLLENWETIIGADYAALTSPVAVRFITPERREGTLTLACPSPLALELQHDTPMILERINRLFGYTAVARLQLVPPKLALPEPAAAARKPRPVDPALLDGIEDEELRERLAALGGMLGR